MTAAAAKQQTTDKKETKLIALTFDDGPSVNTNALLDALAKHGAKATFFVIGRKLKVQPDAVRRIYSDGHQVAQHTYSHPLLTNLNYYGVAEELERTDAELDSILGKQTRYLLRPPFGAYNQSTLKFIFRPAINWSIDTHDWDHHDSSLVTNVIVNQAKDGAIILCHDIVPDTIAGVVDAIDILKEQGYEFVTVREMFRRRGISLEYGKVYDCCPSTDVDYGAAQVPIVSTVPSNGMQLVTLIATPGTQIYYTIDGRDPALFGKVYTEPFLADNTAILRCFSAFDRNGDRSAAFVAPLGVPMEGEPTVQVFDRNIMFIAPEDVQVRYTTDGSLPTEASKLYSEPIPCYDGVLTYRGFRKDGTGITRVLYTSEGGNLFWDVPNTEWYFDEMDQAISAGLFNGTAQYIYEPNSNMTRAMFITTLFRMMDGQNFNKSTTKLDFSDVTVGSWYADAVAWGVNNGILYGYEDGTFRPDAQILREEMCVMLDRLFSLLGIKKMLTEMTFADNQRISGWAWISVSRMVAAGIIRGDSMNCFAPDSFATRAQVAAVLVRSRAFINEMLNP